MNTTPETGLVLDLSTLAPERELIRIKSSLHPDGKLYELASIEDLGIEDQQELAQRGAMMERLVKRKGLPTKEQAQELALVLDKIIDLVVPDLEDPVKASLTQVQKAAIANAFTEASPNLAAAMEAMKPQNPQTSAN